VFLLIPGIAETQFPVPIFEVVAKLSHLTANSGIEKHVVERGLSGSDRRVVNAPEANPGGHRNSGKWCAGGQSRVRDREGIKRILDWHTDPAIRTKGRTAR